MNNKFLVLIGVSLLSFTGFLDATIVSTALPAIQTSLHMSVTELQWIMNAFFLGISAFMASMGKVADIYGRRLVFYIGTIIFALASIGAGLSTHAYWLITFRAIQGIMTAITIPVGIALIQTVFTQEELPKAMALFATITGSGLALGPVIGGALVSTMGWPAVFYINIPFVIVGFLFCLVSVKESRSEQQMSLDYFGILFLALTTASLVFAVVEANQYGWSSRIIIASFIVFVLSLMLLIFTETKASYPIMASELFKNKVFIPNLLFSFTGGGLMSVILFVNPLYLHLIAGKTLWVTGVLLFIIPLFVVTGSPVIGQINHRIGCRPLLVTGAMLYLLSAIGQLCFGMHLNYYILVPTFVIFGLAWAIVNQVPAVSLGQSIDSDHTSVAMGALFTFYNIGAAVLLAIGVALFHMRAISGLLTGIAKNHIKLSVAEQPLLQKFIQQPDQMQKILDKLKIAHPSITPIFKDSFTSGMHAMFWPLILCSLIALFAVVFFMRGNTSENH